MNGDFESNMVKDMSFEELVKQLKDRLDFHVHRNQHKLPGYEADDIRQELLIVLWKRRERIPQDMHVVDYRFTRYLDSMFNRRIIDLYRTLRGDIRTKAAKDRPFKDCLNNATLYENMAEIFDI